MSFDSKSLTPREIDRVITHTLNHKGKGKSLTPREIDRITSHSI